MSANVEVTTKAGVRINVHAVTGGGGGGGGVSAHGDLTGLTTGDDHTQYQRSEAFYTASASYTVTDQSLVITAGSAVTLPDAEDMAGRVVGVGAAAQTVTISPAGTDTMFDDPGNAYQLPVGNGITFVAVQIGGNWGWAVYTRNGPAFDMPAWFAQSLAEGKVLRINSSGTPAWAVLVAADVPSLAASKITSGTFDADRLPAASTSAQGAMSSTDKSKLDGIASGATANSTDATLLNRANHTGTQAAGTITGLTTVATDTIFDATGDLPVGTGADTSARLAKGTQGQLLAVGSSTLGYIAAPPAIGGYSQPTASDHSTFGITSTVPIWASLANQGGPTSGRIVLVPIELDVNLTISAIAFTSGTTAGATLTNQWFVLCNSSKLALAYTSNDTTTAWNSNTRKQLSLTSSYTTTYRGRHYLGVLVTAATTPSLRGLGTTGTGIQTYAFSADTGLTTPGTAGTTAYTGTAASVGVYYGEVV